MIMGRILKPRHFKLLGLLVMALSLVMFLGLYLFVALHYQQFWSLFINMGLFFASFLAPAICFGYDSDNDVDYLMQKKRIVDLDKDEFLNRRDCGYVFGVMFYLLTFVIPVVPWYEGNFRLGGVLGTFLGNFLFSVFFIAALRIFVVKRGGTG